MDEKKPISNGTISSSTPSLPVIHLSPVGNGSAPDLLEDPTYHATSLQDLGKDLAGSRASLKDNMSLTHRRASLYQSSQDIISIHVDRPIFTQEDFDEDFSPQQRHSKTFKERIKNTASQCVCGAACIKNFLFGIFPFLGIMKAYNIKEDAVNDLISGLTVGVMHIPQGKTFNFIDM
jgi:hypothetical protein